MKYTIVKREPNTRLYDIFLTLCIAFSILYIIYVFTPMKNINVYLT